MKKNTLKIKSIIAAFALSAITITTVSAQFTAGNLVIYRVGDGTASLVNTGNPVFLDEYTPTGTLVQSVAMPTTANGNNKALVSGGTSTTEGMMTRSADGKFLVLTGYDGVGTTSLSASDAPVKNRVVGIVNSAGAINTTTALTDFADKGSPRSVTSSNGTDLWVAGSTGGVRYTTAGSSTSTQISGTLNNVRCVNIFDGQLFLSTGSGSTVRVGSVGAGLPTTANQTLIHLAGLPLSGSPSPSPYSFLIVNTGDMLQPAFVLYVADDAAGILKYSLVGGVWTANGSITASSAVRGITGKVTTTGGVELFATFGGSGSNGGAKLYKFNDNTGYNNTVTGVADSIVINTAKMAFRGIAYAPTGSVGIEEQTNNIQINAYPVPAENEVTLNFQSSANANATLVVYDMLGKELIKNTYNLVKGNNTLQLSLDAILPTKQNLIVRITTTNETGVVRIMK